MPTKKVVSTVQGTEETIVNKKVSKRQLTKETPNN